MSYAWWHCLGRLAVGAAAGVLIASGAWTWTQRTGPAAVTTDGPPPLVYVAAPAGERLAAVRPVLAAAAWVRSEATQAAVEAGVDLFGVQRAPGGLDAMRSLAASVVAASAGAPGLALPDAPAAIAPPLRLVGYVGGESGYLVAFRRTDDGDAMVARVGMRLGETEVVLSAFEVSLHRAEGAGAAAAVARVARAELHDRCSGRVFDLWDPEDAGLAVARSAPLAAASGGADAREQAEVAPVMGGGR